MARPSNTDERRLQIVLGMLHAMAELGYDGASTQAIAQAAGLSAGLVHYHFASKLEILLGLIELLGTRLRERYQRLAVDRTEPRERLHAFLDAHVALGTDSDPRAVACWVAIGAEALRNRDVQAAFRRAVREDLNEFAVLIGAVLDAEGRSAQATEDIAAGLCAAIHGSYQLATAAQATPKGFAASALRQMANGLLDAQPKVALTKRARATKEPR